MIHVSEKYYILIVCNSYKINMNIQMKISLDFSRKNIDDLLADVWYSIFIPVLLEVIGI